MSRWFDSAAFAPLPFRSAAMRLVCAWQMRLAVGYALSSGNAYNGGNDMTDYIDKIFLGDCEIVLRLSRVCAIDRRAIVESTA